ncbi:hypothetical protein Acife_2938 [Acidithiobacillus ferrivorans SS3]|uniref:Uncharacterized protein n=1 Tax=Acidithiobacillus ferrivorans SS3 TaxID=743299 RepID=G0JTP7_9PROT|nr:hypothetical protein Acife_2938 [Acidithiobacillus ferrivorans SS3]
MEHLPSQGINHDPHLQHRKRRASSESHAQQEIAQVHDVQTMRINSI